MEAIKVFIRLRPIENQNANSITVSSNNKILSIDSHRQVQCQYDHVFGSKATQEEVYSRVKSCIESALQGYNCTIMAYGQTGSGKSHSMFGLDGDIKLNPGIIPRSIQDIFQGLLKTSRKAVVHVSFMQVYNEQVYDLFDKRMLPLDVHEMNGNIVVKKLMQYRVSNIEQCLALIDIGLKSRTTRETTMNNASSRSHSILQIIIEQDGVNQMYSKVNLVDLAGSERWGLGRICNEQKAELTNINSSLHTLGRCIASLAKVSKDRNTDIATNPVHIPYRDSKLTRILQDSLGGNSKTCLLATINPSSIYGDENISTLRFADRAHQVMTHAKINKKAKSSDYEVAMLREEINRLQQLLYANGILDQQRPELSMPIHDDTKENEDEKECVIAFEDEQNERAHEEIFGDQILVNSVPTTAAEDSKWIIQANAKNANQMPSEEMNCTPSTIEIKRRTMNLEQKQEEVRKAYQSNLPLSHNAACEKIVGMLGSVLILVDTFLTSTATLPVVVDKQSCSRKSQESLRTPRPYPDWCSFSATTPSPKTSQQKKKTMSNKQDIPNRLSSLINQRKRLKGENFESESSSEEKTKLDLMTARKKIKKKMQLRNWVLEKEQRAANPLEIMQ